MPSFNLDDEGFRAPNMSLPTSQDMYIGRGDFGHETLDIPQISHVLAYPHVWDNSAAQYQVNQVNHPIMSREVMSNNPGISGDQFNELSQNNYSYHANMTGPTSMFNQAGAFHYGNTFLEVDGYTFYSANQVNVPYSFGQVGQVNMAGLSHASPYSQMATPQSFLANAHMTTLTHGAPGFYGSGSQAPHSLNNHTRSLMTGALVLNGPNSQAQILNTSSNRGYTSYNTQTNLAVPHRRARRSNARRRRTTSILRPVRSNQNIQPLLYFSGVTLEEFHFFDRLPKEVRFMIWHFALIPRVVEVRISRRDAKDIGRPKYNFQSFTPKPKVFSICQESRYEAMTYYKPMFAHMVNGVVQYIWVGPSDTVYFSFFRSGIGSNQSAAAMLTTALNNAVLYDMVAIPKGIDEVKKYEHSTLQFLTHVAVPLPLKNPHFKLLAEILVRCPNLKTVRLWNNVLSCTPSPDRLGWSRGRGKMMTINDVAPISNPAKARRVGNFNEEQARDHFIGWLKDSINKSDHPNGLKELPLVELGRMKSVGDNQWQVFLK